MSLADDLESIPHRLPGPRCSLSRVLRKHPEAEAIRAAVYDEDRPASRIEEVLDRHGVWISQGTIARHRRGQCKHCAL